MQFLAVTPSDVPELTTFLHDADLTLSGLDSPTVRLWVARSPDGTITASTGYEISDDGRHVLIRSVAVDATARRAGMGTVAAQHAIDHARAAAATRAWLFSRRSGPFWQKLGFEPADRDEMASSLASTHQVQLFVESGQLQREVAWSRPL